MRLRYQFQGQRSRSPVPLMLTHIVCHIFQTAMPTNFKLGIWMKDDDPHQPQVPRLPMLCQRSRSQGHVISLSCVGPMLYLAGGGGYRVGQTQRPHFLLCCCYNLVFLLLILTAVFTVIFGAKSAGVTERVL